MTTAVRARRAFIFLCVIGSALSGLAIFGLYRIIKILNGAAFSGAAASACGCAAAPFGSGAVWGSLESVWMLLALAFVFSAIIAIGLLRVLLTFAATRLFLRRVLASAVPLEEKLGSVSGKLGLTGAVLEISHGSKVFCFGLIRPKICVGSDVVAVLSAEELSAVLVHERHHMANRDPLRAFLVAVFAGMFWFLPGMRQAARDFRLLSEFGADDAASRSGSLESPLKSALVKVSAIYQKEPRWLSGHTAVMFFALTDSRLARLGRGAWRPDGGLGWRKLLVSANVAAFVLAGPLVLFSGQKVAAPPITCIRSQVVYPCANGYSRPTPVYWSSPNAPR